jgi:hypothetical protein
MGIKIADAYVDVDLRDNTDRDLAALVAKLKAANPNLQVDADTDKAKHKLEVLDAEAKKVGGEHVEIKADADTEKAREKIRGLGDEVKATEAKAQGTVGRGGWLASGIAGLALITPQAAAAGAALAGFGAVSAPAVLKVVMAQKDLAASWSTLDAGQKASSANLQGLIGEYKALAKSYEPQALSAFNRAVETTRQLMPQLNPLLQTSTREVSDFLARMEDGVTSGGARQFTSFLTANMGPALHDVGGLIGATSGLATTLIEDLAPAGTTFLHVTTGVVGMTNALAKANPHLAEMAVVGYALRAPIAKLSEFSTKAGTGLKAFAAETKGASLATKGLNLITSAGPNVYLAAGAAIAYFAARALTARDSTDNLISAIRTENNATGNNIQGHLLAAKALGEVTTGYATYNKIMSMSMAERRKHADEADVQKMLKVAKAIDEENAAARRGVEGEKYLAQAYGLTSTQAGQLATAAGVDLTKGVTGSGDAAVSARAKISAYIAAVQQANDPTRVISQAWETAGNAALALKDRTAALSTALNAYFSPSLSVYDNTTKLRQAFLQAAAAMKESHGSLGLATEKSRAAREAFAGLLSQTSATAQSIYTFTSQTKGAAAASNEARASVQKQLPVLLAMAGNSSDARNQVIALAKSFNQGATDSQVLGGALGLTRKQFLAAAASAGVSQSAANRLWSAYNKLPKSVRTDISSNAAQVAGAIGAVQRAINSLHGKNVTNHVHTVYTSSGSTTFGGNNVKLGNAAGGVYGRNMVRRYAAGDLVDAVPATHDLPPNVTTGPIALYGEAGPEAFIPLDRSRRARSTMLLEAVAAEFGLQLVKMAAGGVQHHASGHSSAKARAKARAQRSSSGASLIAGLTDAMLHSLDSVNSYASKVNDAIKKYFTGSTETKILKWAKGIEHSMQDAAKKAEALAEKIKEAKDYAANVTGSAKTFANVSGLGTVGSAADLLTGLRFRSGQLTKYSGDIAALQSRGASKSLIQQVIDLGAGQGTNLADMLLGADKTTFDQINRTQSAIDKAATTVGNNAADAIYDSGKNAAKGFLTGLYGQQAELDKLMDHLAGQMAKGLAKYLGVKGSKAKAPATKTHASGGWAQAGELATVGERGRELIQFGAVGGRVYTARQTQDILAGRSGVRIDNLNVQVAGTWDLSDPATNKRVAELLARNVREAIRREEMKYA